MSGEATPYVRSKSGRLHVARCGVGGHGEPVDLTELLATIPSGWATVRYFTITASCCGASPGAWLRQNHPEIARRTAAFAESGADQ